MTINCSSFYVEGAFIIFYDSMFNGCLLHLGNIIQYPNSVGVHNSPLFCHNKKITFFKGGEER